MPGFIIVSGTSIDAFGATEDAAWADLRDELGPDADQGAHTCVAATDALLGVVEARGGGIAWWTLAGGTACTEAEQFAEVAARQAADAARAAAVEDLTAAQRIPDTCASWADTRREMLRLMAAAHLGSHPRVVVSRNGILQWTAAAPTRHETAPHAPRPCSLALDERQAAEEMRDNLSESRFEAAIFGRDSQRRADKRDRLRAAGRALFGHEWISPLADALSVSLRTAQRWAAGDFETPDWVFDRELPPLARRALAAGVADELLARAAIIAALAGAPRDAR